MKRETRRRLGDQLGDEVAIEADTLRAAIDLGAAGSEDRQRLVAHEFEAGRFEDAHRGVVNRLELLGPQDLDRPVGIDQPAPGRLAQGAGDAPRPAARRFAARGAGTGCRGWFLAHRRPKIGCD